MSRLHEKIDNPEPSAGDKVATYSAALSAWVLTSLTQLVTYVLAAIPIEWGTWTPAATATTNVDAVTANGGRKLRVGTMAMFFQNVTLDATAGGVQTEFRLPTPFTTDLGSNVDVGGTVVGRAETLGVIVAEPTNDVLRCIFNTSSTASHDTWVFGWHRVS